MLKKSFAVFFVTPDNQLLLERNCFGLTFGEVREVLTEETNIDNPELVVFLAGSLYHLSSSQDGVPMEFLGIEENSRIIVYSCESFRELRTSIKTYSHFTHHKQPQNRSISSSSGNLKIGSKNRSGSLESKEASSQKTKSSPKFLKRGAVCFTDQKRRV